MLCGEEPQLLSKHSNIETRLGTQLVFHASGSPSLSPMPGGRRRIQCVKFQRRSWSRAAVVTGRTINPLVPAGNSPLPTAPISSR